MQSSQPPANKIAQERQNLNEELAIRQNRLIENLQDSERRYADLVSHLRDTIFKLDTDFNWVFLNPSWQVLSGLNVTDTLNTEFGRYFSVADNELCLGLFKRMAAGELQEICERITITNLDSEERILELSCRAIKNVIGHFIGIAGIMTDITERIRAEQKISHMAYHDALTGLANRRLLLENLTQSIVIQGQSRALIYIDLDHFKQVNDVHGHRVGDLLLCTVADRLKQQLSRFESTIARIGGDEFVVYLNVEESEAEQVQNALIEVAESIRLAIGERVSLGMLQLYITASLGVVLLTAEHVNADDALKFADAAMYHSKTDGRNIVKFYDEGFELEKKKKRAFEKEIERAVKKKQFILYYQPQVEVQTEKVVKVEGLIRWCHPTSGLIQPDNFIPFLEESGLIVEVGSWVLAEGCRQLQQWASEGVDNVCLSINVSASQFKAETFVQEVADNIKRFNIPAHLLELELTEGVAVSNVKSTIDKMKQLNAIGVKIALDDFGTGYSSLAYLKHFPVQTLKIDKSFIHGVPSDGYDAAIVETTMVMAKHLGLRVVAEGVENVEQLSFLKEQECPLYQGYLYSTPLAAEDILPILKKE